MLSQVAQQLGRLSTTQGDSAEGARPGWNPDWASLAKGALVRGYTRQEGVPFPSSCWDGLMMTHELTPALTHAAAQKGVSYFPHLGWPLEPRNGSAQGHGSSCLQVRLGPSFCSRLFKWTHWFMMPCCRHLHCISRIGLVCSPPFSPPFCIFSLSTFSA